MAIGNYYPISPTVVDQDLFLGTRAGGNNTVNYTAQTVSNYLNTNSKIAIGGQISFKFDISPNIPRTISFPGGGGDGTAFHVITQLVVSSIDLASTDITIFLNYLAGSEILLSQQNQPNLFGHYKITGYIRIGTSNFYTLDLEYIGGNGTITSNTYYNLSSFVLSGNVSVPTLNQVLTVGNTSLLDAKIGELYLYDTLEEGGYGKVALYDSQFDFYNNSGNQVASLGTNGVVFYRTPGYYSRLLATTVTANRTYDLPNASGTIALTSDIPSISGYVPYVGANTDVVLGLNSLFVGNSNEVSISQTYISIVDNGGSPTKGVGIDPNQVSVTNGGQNLFITSSGIQFNDTSFQSTAFPPTGGTVSQYIRGNGTLATFPTIPTITPSALTKTNDTNVTLTLGGNPNTALLAATSLTLGWTGTLADSRITSSATWNAKQDALSGTGLVKSTAGTISYITDNSSNWNTAYTNRITSLTTTGTGAATLIASVLNIPTPDFTNYVPYTGATGSVNLGTNNLSANNFFDGFTSVVASGTLITLTINSTPSYLVTGSGGQTIKMPVATTLPNGTVYVFNNNQSSGAILVNNNSNTLIKSVPSGGNMVLELIDNSTTAGSWDAHFQVPSNVSWSTNTFDYAGSITSATWNGNVIAINRGGTGSATQNFVDLTTNQTIAGAKTFSTAPILSSLTASQILALDGSGNIQSLPVATYPSLTELSYSKGVTSAIQTQLNAKQNTLGYIPYRYINTTQSTVTGTTAETIMATATISANTFAANDVMKILYEVSKTATIVSTTLRIKINTSNTLTGATTIATYSFALANTYALIQRNFIISNGNLIGFGFTASSLTDIVAGTTAATSTSYNPTNVLYLFFTIQLGNVSDTANFTMGNITN